MQVDYTPDVGNTVASTGLQIWNKTAADGAAATATPETVVGGQGPRTGIALGSVVFVPAAALTANDTNYATISVFKRTGGGAAVLIATINTTLTVAPFSGNWTAWVAVPLQIQTGNGSFIGPNDTVTVTITKTGTGVVVPQGQLEIFPLAA